MQRTINSLQYVLSWSTHPKSYMHENNATLNTVQHYCVQSIIVAKRQTLKMSLRKLFKYFTNSWFTTWKLLDNKGRIAKILNSIRDLNQYIFHVAHIFFLIKENKSMKNYQNLWWCDNELLAVLPILYQSHYNSFIRERDFCEKCYKI